MVFPFHSMCSSSNRRLDMLDVDREAAGPAALAYEPGLSFYGHIEGCIFKPPGETVFDSYTHFQKHSALLHSHSRFPWISMTQVWSNAATYLLQTDSSPIHWFQPSSRTPGCNTKEKALPGSLCRDPATLPMQIIWIHKIVQEHSSQLLCWLLPPCLD